MDLPVQLSMKQEAEAPIAQMEEWTYPYAAYTGYYDINLPENSRVGKNYLKLKVLWADTLKQLMIADSDSDFDRILSDYMEKRQTFGYEEVLNEETRQIQANKKK